MPFADAVDYRFSPFDFGDPAGRHAAGETVREVYELHREDGDFGQAGTHHGPRGARRRRP
ncbi:hypothetical protein J7E88_07175 [Streptomyces sp. ISL-10]|uniref:hypothetical protein n=1 Tax=Streptomyces sp. ISL-10 TaxID=2819172 RepID=UPI001BE700AF|nr:hypothetical protein [Streptomyces sp. ISL-10]MBT2365106.1 hypothetical protein [Streptomyces sp. ISL-10]